VTSLLPELLENVGTGAAGHVAATCVVALRTYSLLPPPTHTHPHNICRRSMCALTSFRRREPAVVPLRRWPLFVPRSCFPPGYPHEPPTVSVKRETKESESTIPDDDFPVVAITTHRRLFHSLHSRISLSLSFFLSFFLSPLYL
jgi:hypothetical protein